MHYLYLIYSKELEQQPSEEEMAEGMEAWLSYTQWLKDEGVYVSGEALESISTATTVHRDAGQVVLTDGPFAETKEQLGGFYMVSCENLDEALHYAKPCPITYYGRLEVRPIMPTPTS